MNTSEQINELAAALSKAQASMTGAQKDSNNPFFKSSYADLSSVMESISTPFADNGLSFVQSPGFDEGLVSVTTRIMHSSGQWIEGTTVLPPTKNDAQGYGSAITYAKRYGLQAMAGVPSVDDDGNAAVKHAEDRKPARISRKKGQEYIKSIETLLGEEDALGLQQLNDELKADEDLMKHVWGYFDTAQKSAAKTLLNSVKDES